MADYTMIPKEIKQLNQWVCVWNDSKVPMRSFERRAASSVDPLSWGSFESAEKAVADGKYDQIGFVFYDNGIVGIDIDVGFEDGILTPLCCDIMNACKSYTERSRSGRGVHILLRGKLPFHGKNNREGVEIYQSRRFFITTGDVLLFDHIIDNQEAIDYVVNTYFPDTPRENAGEPLVERIYTPIWPEEIKPGEIPIRPDYPEIQSGGRNVSLLSLAGKMWSCGFSKRMIYLELRHANKVACKPPLKTSELESIVNSITKYQRG